MADGLSWLILGVPSARGTLPASRRRVAAAEASGRGLPGPVGSRSTGRTCCRALERGRIAGGRLAARAAEGLAVKRSTAVSSTAVNGPCLA